MTLVWRLSSTSRLPRYTHALEYTSDEEESEEELENIHFFEAAKRLSLREERQTVCKIGSSTSEWIFTLDPERARRDLRLSAPTFVGVLACSHPLFHLWLRSLKTRAFLGPREALCHESDRTPFQQISKYLQICCIASVDFGRTVEKKLFTSPKCLYRLKRGFNEWTDTRNI